MIYLYTYTVLCNVILYRFLLEFSLTRRCVGLFELRIAPRGVFSSPTRARRACAAHRGVGGSDKEFTLGGADMPCKDLRRGLIDSLSLANGDALDDVGGRPFLPANTSLPDPNGVNPDRPFGDMTIESSLTYSPSETTPPSDLTCRSKPRILVSNAEICVCNTFTMCSSSLSSAFSILTFSSFNRVVSRSKSRLKRSRSRNALCRSRPNSSNALVNRCIMHSCSLSSAFSIATFSS